MVLFLQPTLVHFSILKQKIERKSCHVNIKGCSRKFKTKIILRRQFESKKGRKRAIGENVFCPPLLAVVASSKQAGSRSMKLPHCESLDLLQSFL